MRKLLLIALLAIASPSWAGFVLTWQDNSNNEVGFVIQRKIQGGTYADVLRPGMNATSVVDPLPGAVAGQVYCYVIFAYNTGLTGQEQRSNPSNEACGTIPAGVVTIPTLAVASVTDTQANLSWNRVTDSAVTSIELRRRTVVNGVPTTSDFPVSVGVPLSATTYTDATVSPGTTYQYRLAIKGAAGALIGTSNIVEATTLATPAPIPGPASPTNLTAQPQ